MPNIHVHLPAALLRKPVRDAIKPYVSSDRDGWVVLNSQEQEVKKFPKTKEGREAAQKYLRDHWGELSKTKDESSETKGGTPKIGDKVKVNVDGQILEGTVKAVRGNLVSVAYVATLGGKKYNKQDDFHIAKVFNASGKAFLAKDESPETKERHEGALNEKETAMASEHVEHREDTPASVFLMPAARKYPVKTKQDGEYKYDRGLLLAAAREARMHGHGALADRADAIREREFGAKDEKRLVVRNTGPDKWHVFREGWPVALAGPFKTSLEAAEWVKKHPDGKE